jgi:glycerophosphoryl diester phosphodiesterase
MKPILIAHRGASGLVPENTLSAVLSALDLGADAIEIDVRRTKDGAIVLMHDATLQRTAGSPQAVADLTLDEVRRADAGAWFGADFAGERVPTLAEVLSLTKGKAVLAIEIKPTDITEDVLSVIAQEKAEEWVNVMSFHDAVVRRVREVAPHLPSGLIVGVRPEENAAQQAIALVRRVAQCGAGVLSLSHPAVNPTLAREVRRRGVALWTWTVDDPQRMQEVAQCGVDGIITNFPNRLREVLRTG